MSEEESDDPVEFLEDDEPDSEYSQHFELGYHEETDSECEERHEKDGLKSKQKKLKEDNNNKNDLDQRNNKQSKFPRAKSTHLNSTNSSGEINPYESMTELARKKTTIHQKQDQKSNPTPAKEKISHYHFPAQEKYTQPQHPHLHHNLQQQPPSHPPQQQQHHKTIELDRPKHWKSTLTPARTRKLSSSPKGKRKSSSAAIDLLSIPSKAPKHSHSQSHTELSFKPNFLKQTADSCQHIQLIETETGMSQFTPISMPYSSINVPKPTSSTTTFSSTTTHQQYHNNHHLETHSSSNKSSTRKFREGSLSHLFQHLMKESESLQLQFSISLSHYPLNASSSASSASLQTTTQSPSPSKSRDLLNPRNRTKYWIDLSHFTDTTHDLFTEGSNFVVKNCLVVDYSSPLLNSSTAPITTVNSTSTILTPTKSKPNSSNSSFTTPTKESSTTSITHTPSLEKGSSILVYFRKDRLAELKIDLLTQIIRVYDYSVVPNWSKSASQPMNVMFCTQLCEKIDVNI